MPDSPPSIAPDRYRVPAGTTVDLRNTPTSAAVRYDSKSEGRAALKGLANQLDHLQRLLWADGRHKLLVVLQAMDGGGKDGTIRRVFGRLNPQGVRVTSFKVPTAEELAHDYLWRVHEHAPGAGEIAVFNRSHYEDVLVVRVLGLAPESRWRQRYRHITEFERLLTDEGTTILKFYLHISRDEQARRLQARLDDPEKRWKFNVGDLEHRRRWDEYMDAYERAIAETSTEAAPWFVVPADRKWQRDLIVASAARDALAGLDLAYPDPEEGTDGIEIT